MIARRALLNAFARCAGLIRVSLYSVLMLGLVLGYGVHSARGAIGERSLALGRELEGMRDLLGNTKAVTLNGQRMMLSTAVVPLGVSAALDRFEALCQRGPNALAHAVDQIPEARSAGARIPISRRLGVLRNDNPRDGIVACIVHRGDRVLELSELMERLTQTLDIGLLGDFFFVYARDASVGGKRQSHLITSWTHGSFQPSLMFPASGDAPGSDSLLAARPGDARRVLSGVAVDAPYALRVYETDAPPGPALARFDTSMADRGWLRLQPAKLADTTHVYTHRSGVTALAIAASSKLETCTVFSVIEMGSPNQDQAAL
ncbi:MAG TPA: hypothetical protein VFK05_13525 [Polyangiaceae bacterium]|nr:hypothetical protein [Polyangiaceae bacterium]